MLADLAATRTVNWLFAATGNITAAPPGLLAQLFGPVPQLLAEQTLSFAAIGCSHAHEQRPLSTDACSK